MKFLKGLILKDSGKISLSKLTVWLAGVTTAIAELNVQIAAAGIPIPPELLPVVKAAAITSAVIAGIRLRNAATNKPKVIISNTTTTTSSQS